MFFSLVAAFVFTPWFALRVRPRLKALERAERHEERTRAVVARFYRPLVTPLIRAPWARQAVPGRAPSA
jgi:multidrug efflux pump subunit AcrB